VGAEVSVFNLSLDDVCAHPKCTPFPSIIDLCNKLIERWPGIKIDFFISSAYARLNEEPYFLAQYPEWVKQMNELPAANFRFNTHGFWHRRLSKQHGNSNNGEFEYLTKQQAHTVLVHMIGEFEAAGLKYEKVFRAPGFRLSRGSAEALTELGFSIAGKKDYSKANIPGFRFTQANWNLREECTLAGDVLAAGHTSTWCDNYFGPEVCDRVVKLLETKSYKFKFLSEL
jgi:Uncharacterized protein conserved in bacteria (DUF2334)